MATQALTGWGVPMAGVQIVDGSGLDRGNRLTCHALVAVLAHGGAALQAGLAVAGKTGTLDDTFTNSPVKGRLRAKTGTLTGVKSLTGVVPAGEHLHHLRLRAQRPERAGARQGAVGPPRRGLRRLSGRPQARDVRADGTRPALLMPRSLTR